MRFLSGLKSSSLLQSGSREAWTFSDRRDAKDGLLAWDSPGSGTKTQKVDHSWRHGYHEERKLHIRPCNCGHLYDWFSCQHVPIGSKKKVEIREIKQLHETSLKLYQKLSMGHWPSSDAVCDGWAVSLQGDSVRSTTTDWAASLWHTQGHGLGDSDFLQSPTSLSDWLLSPGWPPPSFTLADKTIQDFMLSGSMMGHMEDLMVWLWKANICSLKLRENIKQKY